MKIIDGKEISAKIKENVKENVVKLKEKGIHPSLAILLVGHNPASEVYVRNKLKACELVGIEAKLYSFEEDSKEEDICKTIEKLNHDPKVHAILLQSPLPSSFNEKYIASLIEDKKDVDGFSSYNLGKLASNEENIIAATPYGIIKMLEYENIHLDGANVVVIGRSKIVGRPMALALLNRSATVTICHSHTKNLKEICKTADILIVAIGKPKLITREYIKEGAVIIDVGTNRNSEGKLVGDVDFEDVKDLVSYITPVPGGVGPMTIAMLLSNTVDLAKKEMK